MGRDFLLHNADFAGAVDAYDEEFQKAAGWSIKAELLKEESDTRIDDTTVTQPALFAIQAGLAAVWRRFGVTPDMVVGHSIGEAAAAFVAGGLSNQGAARFLSKRGAIRDQLGAKGAMAAVGLGVEEVEAMLPEHGLIGIAAINGPGSTTISGDYDSLHAFVEEFQAAQARHVHPHPAGRYRVAFLSARGRSGLVPQRGQPDRLVGACTAFHFHRLWQTGKPVRH